jgi:lycopene beta-cyclase
MSDNVSTKPRQMFDYLLIGGGLQNALIGLALLERRPGVRIALVERADRLGGNHTWCFHADDVAASMQAAIAPLVAHRWEGYTVAFPNLARTVAAPYAAVTSERLHRVVTAALAAAPGCAVLTGRAALEVSGDAALLVGGERLRARAVIDARGPNLEPPSSAGYQKFLGHELTLRAPHGLDRPVLMDAKVTQTDGYRFFYLLPFDDRRLLVEDTYFSDDPTLDVEALRGEIASYVAGRGWQLASSDREESGVLPLPWDGTCEPGDRGPLVAGYAGGWFHPATGYSFPVAARLADLVASVEPGEVFGPQLRRLARAQRRQLGFCHRLNHMLFHWFPPDERWNAFERFYKLPEPTIRRFYAMQLSRLDRGRILVGRPPRGISWRAVFARGDAS